MTWDPPPVGTSPTWTSTIADVPARHQPGVETLTMRGLSGLPEAVRMPDRDR